MGKRDGTCLITQMGVHGKVGCQTACEQIKRREVHVKTLKVVRVQVACRVGDAKGNVENACRKLKVEVRKERC